MTKFDLKRATVEELIERFLALGIEQDKMEMEGFGSRANRAIRARLDVEDELKGRDSDARRLLVRFYEHQNIQVQCNAASATLALFPEKARRKLEQIRSRKLGVTSLEAGMTLVNIDKGRDVPR